MDAVGSTETGLLAAAAKAKDVNTLLSTLQRYGVVALIAFVLWTGWNRESRMEAQSEAHIKAMVQMSTDTGKALTDIEHSLRQLHEDCAVMSRK